MAKKLPKKTEKCQHENHRFKLPCPDCAPRKTEKVLRDMAKDPYHIYLHQHDAKKCIACDNLWHDGEKFGRENHVVTKCNHPEPKPIVIGVPWYFYVAWMATVVLVWAWGFYVGFGPNWAGTVR